MSLKGSEHVELIVPEGLLKVAQLTFHRHAPVHLVELPLHLLIIDLNQRLSVVYFIQHPVD
jgi:hypothetical protein